MPTTSVATTTVAFHDHEPEIEDFEAAVFAGLASAQKSLPCKYFYDQAGSALFERICELDEYYVTRTEIALLERYRTEMAALMGDSCHLIEFGSGSARKVPLLLDALPNAAAYTAIDISKEHLLASTRALAAARPGLEVTAVCADYTRPLVLPRPESRPDAKPVVFFPGSSIGNFSPREAVQFLKRTAETLHGGGELLIGVDLKKDPAILDAAYNDAKGVTAAFNLNLLARINTELGADFDLPAFAHHAHYDSAKGRIEMHLVSLGEQTVRIGGRGFDFGNGERIHTENSYKYSIGEFRDLGREAGFTPVERWTDEDGLFSIHYFRAE